MTDVLMSDWVEVGRYCECRHSKADHEYSNDGACAFGWSGEPDEPEACPCESFVFAGIDVVKAVRP